MQLLLCRIEVTIGDQISFLEDYKNFNDLCPGEVLKKTIESKPKSIYKKEYTWSIANVENIDDRALLFVMGCEKNKELGDKNPTGDFVEVEKKVAPHTRIILDWNLEVCAIQPESELGSLSTLPGKLEKILNDSPIAKGTETTFHVRELDNPEDFIQIIKNAHSVTSCNFAFSQPNFFDPDKDFQQPLQKMAKTVKGKKNYVNFNNPEGLEKNTIVEVSRAIVSAGHEVKANYKEFETSKPAPIKSSGMLAKIEVDSLSEHTERVKGVNLLRETYGRIRHGGELS